MSKLSQEMLFAYLVSEIDISKYKQKEYVKIVKSIYCNIFNKKLTKKINEKQNKQKFVKP